jgi:hypothetical protein
VIEEVEFQSLISLARRALELHGRRDDRDPEAVSHARGGVMVCGRRGVVEVFSGGSLVFRHDPRGETTDYFDGRGGWAEEVERMALEARPSLANEGGNKEGGKG